MAIWILLAVVVLVAVFVMLVRFGRSRDGGNSEGDLGAVSQSWMTEHRAYKHDR